jgi:hypothetical protein
MYDGLYEQGILKQSMKDLKLGKLVGAKKRHPAYKGEEPKFADRASMFKSDITASQGAFAPRQSFRGLNGNYCKRVGDCL